MLSNMKKLSKGREEVFKGMTVVYDYVSRTLGPNGQNVVLDRGFNAPIITNDGVSISEAIEVEDFTQKQGVDLLKFGAKKQREKAGDGTTTFITLTHALIEEGMKYENPMEIKRSLEKAGEKVVEELQKLAKPIKTDKEILQVATIASESEEHGQMILDIIKEIGRDGVISVEQSQAKETEVKIAEGYTLEKGYVNVATGLAQFKNPKVLVVGEKIHSIHDLAPLFDKAMQSGIRQLALFCVDIETEVMAHIARLWESDTLRVLVIKCATQNQEVLHDVAIISGAEYIAQENGISLPNATPEMLGEAKRITADAKQTQIIDGKGKTKDKVEELKAELAKETDPNTYDLIEKRIARLKNEVGVISVGAPTEEAMQYLYYKLVNGVNSTKASIEEGIVAGGGHTLYKIAESLGDSVGERIMKRALRMPLRKIIENGGKDYTEVVLKLRTTDISQQLKKDSPVKYGTESNTYGYDAKNDTFVDMHKAGIIDPVKVERCAVENAISLASTFLTVHGSVSLIRKLETE
jgi:chaperonin GroEL